MRTFRGRLTSLAGFETRSRSRTVIAAFSGVKQTTPVDVAASTNSGKSNPITALGIPPAGAGAMLVWDMHMKHAYASDTTSPPSGFTCGYAPSGEGFVCTAKAIQAAAGV